MACCSIPLRTLADLRRRGAGLFFLQRNHHRRRAGAGIFRQGLYTLEVDTRSGTPTMMISLEEKEASAAAPLQSDFAAADGRDIAAVKIANLTALGEGFANVDGACIPWRWIPAPARRR
jgi:hypothetical protein